MYSIAVVDDELWVLDAISDYIKNYRMDYYVKESFSDAESALQTLLEAPVDVLITDIRMFELSGLELAKVISAQQPATQILMLSAYQEFSYAREAMQYGVKFYLLKPIDYEELSSCLTEIKKHLDMTAVQTSLYNDTVNLFFYYTLAGIFPDREAILLASYSIHLPFDLSQSAVFLIDINVQAKGMEGEELFQNHLMHFLQTHLNAQWVYYMLREKEHYLYVVLFEHIRLVPMSTVSFSLPDSSQCSHTILYRAATLFDFIKLPEIRQYSRILRKKDSHVSGNPVKDLSDTVSPDSVSSSLTANALDYIVRNYARDISRDDIAEAVFVSSAHLSRVFKLEKGISIMDYLMNYRMQKAVGLLKTRKKSSEISEQVGYQNYNTFLVHFRQYTGLSPREYRRTVLRMEDDGNES